MTPLGLALVFCEVAGLTVRHSALHAASAARPGELSADAADHFAITQYVVIIVIPPAGAIARPRRVNRVGGYPGGVILISESWVL